MSCWSPEYVFCSVWVCLGMSVWLASQTSRTITIRGKNALRKKRFTKSPWSGYPTPYFAGTEFLSRKASAYTPSGMSPPPSLVDPLRHQIVVKHPDVGQIPVPLGEIEAVADHEAVRD